MGSPTWTRRSRSRCERRRSSSSTLGMRTTDQTWRSPRSHAISARSNMPTSIRSVFARRARRLTCMLEESTTRHSMPRALRNRASQKAS
jgi:hypothetical protein